MKKLLAFFFCLVTITVNAQDQLIADLGNHLVALNTGFAGADMLLFGAVDRPSDLIAVVRGPAAAIELRKKKQIAGIWINRERSVIDNVPVFYDITSTKPLHELLDPEILQSRQFGLDALSFETNNEVKVEKSFHEALLRLKESQDTFRMQKSRILFVGQNLFRLNVHLPATIPPGRYQVEIFSIREGKIVAAQTTPLIVSKIGFGAGLSRFSQQYPAIYGLCSIFAALSLGFIGHLIFRRR